MSEKSAEEIYGDIINLEHPVSKKHPQMSIYDRSAQFAPFAALAGYEGAIKETGRLTDKKIELDETVKAELDEKLAYISNNLSICPDIEITFFKPDYLKTGGEYITISGIVKKIDTVNKCIVMQDERIIPFNDILDIK